MRIAAFAVLALFALAVPAGADAPKRRYTGSFRACPELDGMRTEKPCDEQVAKLYREPFDKDEPVIELVTMGIGDLIWERHGHIALCVRFKDFRKQLDRLRALYDRGYRNDAERFDAFITAKVDVCSNYGIGSFHEPVGMAWGFFRGTNSFWAGPQSTDELKQIYIGRDRTVWAQPIPLDLKQRTKVISDLSLGVKDENKYYAYDHFWDNCTTRVRDILDDALGGGLKSMTNETDGKTYRDLAREGFFGMRGPLLITDIAMGRVTDRVPSYWERMFLPDYLREAVKAKWGMEPVVLYQRQGEPAPDGGPTGRFLFALIVLVFVAPVILSRRFGRFQRAAMAFAILPYILLGSILWFLAIISPLEYVMWNESCLLFFPGDLCLLFLSPDRRQKYAKARVVMLVAMGLLMLVGVFKQPLLSPLLWPLIPNAIVGFWPEHWTKKPPEKPPEKKPNGKSVTSSGSKKQPDKKS